MRDSVIIAWDTGLGKTLAGLTWPILKKAKRVLFVAPEGLHAQLIQSAMDFYGIRIQRLDSVKTFDSLRLAVRPCAALPAGNPEVYLISYFELGMNSGDEWAPKTKEDPYTGEEEVLPTPKRIEDMRRQFCKESRMAYREELFQNIGECRDGFTCINRPTLATVIRDSEAFDCVVVDEGVRVQGNDSYIANGVRKLTPKYRLLLSATPIKNRLESFFWLAWWIAGGSAEPCPLWPYQGNSEAREDFANSHLQHDQFVTREAEHYKATRSNRKFQKRTARICNIHRLWKLIAPLVIRRTKGTCGEDIQPRILRPITVPPGKDQLALYRYHAKHAPGVSKSGKDVSAKAARMMQLTNLRLSTLEPLAAPLAGRFVKSNFTPKLASVLKIIGECMEKGEQVIVGSCFQSFSTVLKARLDEAGIPAILLDGRISAAKRGILSAEFKAGKFPVMVAGINAMGEGHSFECCPNLILPSLEWAYDLNEQFVNRVWRINSPKPVNIYTVLTKGTVDENLYALFSEKSDSSHLALDGELSRETIEETNLEAFLVSVVRKKSSNSDFIREGDTLQRWNESGIFEIVQSFKSWEKTKSTSA